MPLLPINQKQHRPAHDVKPRVLVYGKPHAGKTTFAATFPEAIILSTDGNYKHTDIPAILLEDRMTKTLDSGIEIDVDGWDYFEETVDELIKDTQYETIILDLVQDVYELAKKKVLTKEGVTEEADLPHGRGWSLVRIEFLRVMKKLLKIDKNIVLITHSVEYPGGIKTTLSDRLYNSLTGYVDIFTYLNQEYIDGQNQRVLYTQTLPGAGDSGNRFGLINAKIFATYDSLKQEIINAKEQKGE